MFDRKARPDTEEIIVSDDPKRALKFVRDSVYGRSMVDSILNSDEYSGDLDESLRLSQFVIVERVGEKAASYGGVKAMKLLKPEQKMFYRLAPESRDAEFLLEIDKKQFESLDQELQERYLFDQMSLVFLDVENAKYRLSRKISVNLKVAKKFGKKSPEVHAVMSNVSAGDDND